MLSIGGATAVTEEEQLISALKGPDDGINRLRESFEVIAEEALLYPYALFEMLDNSFCHGSFCYPLRRPFALSNTRSWKRKAERELCQLGLYSLLFSQRAQKHSGAESQQ
jgi:hypothetical protein